MSDPAARVVARIFFAFVAAAIGAVALLAMFLGFSRAGAPETALRIAGSMFVLTFVVLGFFTALGILFAPLLRLRPRQLVPIAVTMVVAAQAAFLFWLLG